MTGLASVAQGMAACLLVLASLAQVQEPPSTVGPLLKLYRSGKLPAERQPAVIEMICTRGNEHDLRVVLDKLLEPMGMAPAARVKAMAGLADAAATRKIKPAGDLSPLAKLLDEADPATRLAAVRLAAACGVTSASPSLRQLAQSAETTPELRRAALQGLVTLGGDDNRQALQALCAADRPLATRLLAAAGLTAFDVPLAAREGARVLASATPQDDPAPLLEAFFDRKQGSEELAKALAEVTLSVDVAKRALRSMYSVGRSDAELSAVLSHAAGIATDTPPPTPEEVAQIVQDVSTKGDPVRGEAIFRRVDLSCMRCHSVSRAGGQVGPELSAVGGSSPVDYIANSILNPNLAVKEQYVTRVFELDTGKVLSGVVLDRDETRVRIRDAQGKTVVIPTAEIEEESEGASMMPMGLTKFLTRDELLDLIRFVSELGKAGPFAVQTTPRLQRWQLLSNPPAELISEVPHLEHIRQHVLGSNPDAWSGVYARVGGTYPLSDLRKQPGTQVVILRGEVQVNEPGPLVFDIQTTVPFQAWIDGQPATPGASVEAPVEAGRHALILRLEIPAEGEPELRVEVRRPEGSTVQFEVVGGA
ncbi:MAG: HEAT repeat domain-containing protein [Planctomycetaceae bacterium]